MDGPQILKKSVENGTCWIPGTGHPFMFDTYPELIQGVKEALLGLRTASLPVNASIARNILLGLITVQHPNLLQRIIGQHNTPQFSISMVRRFLYRELNWVVRAGTHAGQKYR